MPKLKTVNPYEGVNETRLLGKVCFTPQLKEAHGYRYLRTIVAVNENRNIFGHPKRIKTYHPVTLLNDLADQWDGELKAGMLVYLIGRVNHYFLQETKRMTDVLVEKVHVVAKENPEDVEERESFKEVDEKWLEEFDNVVPISRYMFYVVDDPDVPF